MLPTTDISGKQSPKKAGVEVIVPGIIIFSLKISAGKRRNYSTMIQSAKKTYTYDWSNKNESQDVGPILVSSSPEFLLTVPSKNTDT